VVIRTYIGGVDVETQRGSFSIEERIEERSTASFVIVDEAGILPSLILGWRCDEGGGTILYDWDGGNDLTLYNAPTWEAGMRNDAIRLNGTTQYGRKVLASRLPTTTMTICGWINPDALTDWPGILAHKTFQAGGWILFFDSAGILYFRVYTGGVGFQQAVKTGIVAGAWNFVAATYDGAEITAWVNAVPGAAVACTQALDSIGDLYFGVDDVLTPALYFDGLLDEMLLAHSAFTQRQLELVRDFRFCQTTLPRGKPLDIFEGIAVPPFIHPLFGGFIDTPGTSRIAPKEPLLRHDITCMDNHYLADKRRVVKSYANQTLGFIVTDIFNDYLTAEGITIGAIQTGPTIESAIFNYVRVSEAFDALKELSGFTWFIDEGLRLFFIDRATYAAPWNLDMLTHRPIKGSMHVSTGNSMYRNRQWIKGGLGVTSLQTQHFTGDAVVKSFALGYPVALVPVITLTPGGVQTIGIKGIDTGMAYYWSKGDNTIVATAAPGAGVDVQVDYYGQYPVIALVSDSAEVILRQDIEGGTGIVEDVATEAQLESGDAAVESAKAKLATYCQEAEKLTYQTQDWGLHPGQLQQVSFTPFGLAAHEMLIESVTVTADGEDIIYDISCITGPAMGSWAKFFSNILTRQDKTIKIGDSLLLVLLQQAEILELAEVAARSEHTTEDYHWDLAESRWDFATYA